MKYPGLKAHEKKEYDVHLPLTYFEEKSLKCYSKRRGCKSRQPYIEDSQLLSHLMPTVIGTLIQCQYTLIISIKHEGMTTFHKLQPMTLALNVGSD